MSPPVPVPGPPGYFLFPFGLINGKDASGNGATLAVTWQPSSAWRLQFSYTYFDLEVTPQPDSSNPEIFNVEGDSPKHQSALQSYLDLPRGVSVCAGLRYVDELPAQDVPDYLAFDAHLLWRVSKLLELSLSGG